MIIDPHIAVLRTGPSTDFFDRVLGRIIARSEQPQGVLLQFSTIMGDELMVTTAYANHSTMRDTFVSFTAPAAQEEMVESGTSFDISRDEYELERLHVDPSVAGGPLALKRAGSMAAMTTELISMSPSDYFEFTNKMGWFERPAPGRIAHLAYDHGGRMRALDFWESREAGEAWYAGQVLETFDEMFPGVRTDDVYEASWLDLHSFIVIPEVGDPIRDYARTESGPSQSQ